MPGYEKEEGKESMRKLLSLILVIVEYFLGTWYFRNCAFLNKNAALIHYQDSSLGDSSLTNMMCGVHMIHPLNSRTLFAKALLIDNSISM